jgi:hypothetical protein
VHEQTNGFSFGHFDNIIQLDPIRPVVAEEGCSQRFTDDSTDNADYGPFDVVTISDQVLAVKFILVLLPMQQSFRDGLIYPDMAQPIPTEPSS